MPAPDKRFPERTLCLAIFLVSIALNLGFSFVGFKNSPLEIHEFRQLQTALTSRAIQEQGWSLAYPTPVFGPPWSAPMEFPIYEVCVAKLASFTGIAIEPAARSVSLVFLYLALPACFGLLGLLGISRDRRWLGLSVLLVSPAYLYYSRSIMIESTALCASAWFLLSYCRAFNESGYRWLIAAVLTGILAALTKVTTLIVFLVPAAVYTLAILWSHLGVASERNPGNFRRIFLRGLIATIPAVALGWLWVRYSDGVKTSNPLSAFLASGPMSAFNFGSVAQRLSREFWDRIVFHTTNSVVSAFNLALIVVFALCTDRSARLKTLLLLAGFIAGPLVFSNLYFVHDYYFYASGVFLLGGLSLAWDRLLDAPMFSRGAKWGLIALTLALQLVPYLRGYLPIQSRPMDPIPELAKVVAASTQPDDVILIYGQDWNTKIPYFAHRRAIMVTDVRTQSVESLSKVLDTLEPGRVGALVVTGTLRQFPDYFKPPIQRLKLHPTALAFSNDAMVFVAENRMQRSRSQLEVLALKEFSLAEANDASSPVPRKRSFPAQIADKNLFSMMSPAPMNVVHPFGLGTYNLDGQLVFNAHAPTDLIFELPRRGTQATAEFGVLPDAYSGKNQIEGMEFRVEWVNPDGEHRTLYSSYLDPGHREIDRGTKSLRVALPTGEAGQIWFRTLPGPTGSISCTWGYWGKLVVK